MQHRPEIGQHLLAKVNFIILSNNFTSEQLILFKFSENLDEDELLGESMDVVHSEILYLSKFMVVFVKFSRVNSEA